MHHINAISTYVLDKSFKDSYFTFSFQIILQPFINYPKKIFILSSSNSLSRSSTASPASLGASASSSRRSKKKSEAEKSINRSERQAKVWQEWQAKKKPTKLAQEHQLEFEKMFAHLDKRQKEMGSPVSFSDLPEYVHYLCSEVHVSV